MRFHNFSPGPVDYQLLPTTGHVIPQLAGAYRQLHEETAVCLRQVLGTSGDIVFLPASGTGAIELLLRGVLSPGDKVLILANGFFGERLFRMAEKLGFAPYGLRQTWHIPLDLAAVHQVINSPQFPGTKAVFAVHLETSTGIVNDIAGIGHCLKEKDALFLVDAVSSVGTEPVKMDAWGVAGLVTVSYKGLLGPQGLSILALNPDYISRMIVSDSYYFDLPKLVERTRCHQPATTIPVDALQILHASLPQTGSPAHRSACGAFAAALRERLHALGFLLFGQGLLSNGVTAVHVPGADVPDRLEQEYGIFVGGGLGQLKGQIIRLGHYGNHDWPAIDALAAALQAVTVPNARNSYK